MVDPIYRKTGAGQDEIDTRARKLDHKLRALLLMVQRRAPRAGLAGADGGHGRGTG